MTEFTVNEYICLRLEKDQKVIYVSGEKFNQCKYVLLQRKVNELEDLLALDTVDELADILDRSMEGREDSEAISPETEFWVHCSNLQIWAENNYDTRLLHSNLAFPLLRRLVEIGDIKAQRVFREEIAKRFESRYPSVVAYLVREKYYEFLPFDYIIEIIIDKDLSKAVTDEGYEFDFTVYLIHIGDKYSDIIKNKIIEVIEKEKLEDLIYIKEIGLIDNLNKKDLIFLIEEPKVEFFNKILTVLMNFEEFDYYYDEGFKFSNNIIDNAKEVISKKLIEFLANNSKNELTKIIRLGLLTLIDINDLDLVLIKNVLDRLLDIKFNERFDIHYSYFEFLDKFNEEFSSPLKIYLETLLVNNNLKFIRKFLEDRLLIKLNRDDVNSIVSETNFIQILLEISADLNSRESFFLQGSPFDLKLLNYTTESLKKKIIEIVDKLSESDVLGLIRLRLLNSFSINELRDLFSFLELDVLDYINYVRDDYYYEVKDWIGGFLKRLENS